MLPLIALILLVSAILSTSSLRRKGRMSATTQRVLIGFFAIVAVITAVMTWLPRVG